MFFALGLLTALLFALAIIPALSRRAMRLARRRLELQLPLSPAEILAERDQLRADYAVQLRVSEQKYELAQQAHAEVSGSLGRTIAESVSLSLKAKALTETLAQTETELAKTQRALNETSGEHGATLMALHDESQRRVRAGDELQNLKKTCDHLADEKDALKAELAGLDATKASLELQQIEVQRRMEDMQKQLNLATQENTILAQERDVARLEVENLLKTKAKRPTKAESSVHINDVKPEEIILLRETILNIAADVALTPKSRQPSVVFPKSTRLKKA
eukprot:gene18575-18860_t